MEFNCLRSPLHDNMYAFIYCDGSNLYMWIFTRENRNVALNLENIERWPSVVFAPHTHTHTHTATGDAVSYRRVCGTLYKMLSLCTYMYNMRKRQHQTTQLKILDERDIQIHFTVWSSRNFQPSTQSNLLYNSHHLLRFL